MADNCHCKLDLVRRQAFVGQKFREGLFHRLNDQDPQRPDENSEAAAGAHFPIVEYGGVEPTE